MEKNLIITPNGSTKQYPTKNSIDVDKFDYMRRDAYNVGVTGFDFDQDVFMRETRIIDDTLAYHHKHSYNIYDLFGNRYIFYTIIKNI